jgi:hypothetical protein
VDKKAFKAAGRAQITLFLDENDIAWTHNFSQVKKLYDSKQEKSL